MKKSSKKFINKDKYQVFIFVSYCNFPVWGIASHSWLVINRKGVIERWDFGYTKNRGEENWGHLRKNDKFYDIDEGIQILAGLPWTWKGKLFSSIEGDEAKKVIDVILSSPKNFPKINTYSFLNCNCNTYVSWVINSCPNCNLVLPKNAFGRKINGFDKP